MIWEKTLQGTFQARHSNELTLLPPKNCRMSAKSISKTYLKYANGCYGNNTKFNLPMCCSQDKSDLGCCCCYRRELKGGKEVRSLQRRKSNYYNKHAYTY